MKNQALTRALSLLLVLGLLLAALLQLALPASADTPVYSGVCGSNLTWRFDPDSGLLTIEGTGRMWDFEKYPEDGLQVPWVGFLSEITAVSLPDGLTSLGAEAFIDCENLKNIEFPNSLSAIGPCSFRNCSNLSTVEFPDNITHIYAHAFSGCSGLTSVTFPENITLIGSYAFSGCIGLTSVVLPDNLTVIREGTFEGCTELASVSVPDNLLNIGDRAFCGCAGLAFIMLPDSLTSVGICAFENCLGLTSVVLPTNLTEISDRAFCGCTGLREMSIPENVTFLGGKALADCTGLTSLSILNPLCEINYDCLDGTNALTIFGYCGSTAESLAEKYSYPFVSLGNTDLGGSCGDNLTWHFDGSTGILTIEGNGNMWDYGWFPYSDDNYYVPVPWHLLRNRITNLSLPEGLTSIEENAFEGCERLQKLEIPGSVRTIGNGAFQECRVLTEVIYREGITSTGTDSFKLCSSLKTVQLPSTLQTVDSGSFYGCFALRAITIPEGVAQISNYAFCYCEALTSVTLPKSIQRIEGNAFIQCSSLRKLIFHNPDCLVQSYYENLQINNNWRTYYLNSLNQSGETVIYGIHNAEKENAEMILETVGTNCNGWRWLENYAKTYGYTFFATNVFDDVKEGKYYEIPVAWAYGMGITTGTGEGLFSPGQLCTRAQIVTFLYNAAGKPGYTLTENPFSDVKEGKWYYDAVMWAFENGITSGVDETNFGVSQSCTRGQAMTFLWKSLGSPEPETEDCPFTDVKPGKYYYKAVLWALENGITSGTSPTTFGTQDSCTRGQIVTFLYKAYEEIT